MKTGKLQRDSLLFEFQRTCPSTNYGLTTKPTLNFSGPYRRVRPAKLTNYSARTN